MKALNNMLLNLEKILDKTFIRLLLSMYPNFAKELIGSTIARYMDIEIEAGRTKNSERSGFNVNVFESPLGVLKIHTSQIKSLFGWRILVEFNDIVVMEYVAFGNFSYVNTTNSEIKKTDDLEWVFAAFTEMDKLKKSQRHSR